MTNRMWGGRFDAAPSQLLRALNDSFAFDRELLADDEQGSIAWARALSDAGVLTEVPPKIDNCPPVITVYPS